MFACSYCPAAAGRQAGRGWLATCCSNNIMLQSSCNCIAAAAAAAATTLLSSPHFVPVAAGMINSRQLCLHLVKTPSKWFNRSLMPR